MSRRDSALVRRTESRAWRAAAELSSHGVAVQFIRSIYVPADETCFLLWQGESAEVVAEAARLADLPYERLSAVQAASQDPEPISGLAGDPP